MATNLESLALFQPELILLGTAILVMATDFFLPRQRSRLPLFALVGLFFALVSSLESLERLMLPFHLGADAPSQVVSVEIFAGAVVVDGWTNAFRIIGIAAAGVALMLGLSRRSFRFLSKPSDAEMEPSAKPYGTEGEYSGLILLSTIGVTVMASSRDFLVTLIAFETMSLALYPAMILARTRRSFEATTKYFLLGAGASAVMLFGFSLVFGLTGTSRYEGLSGAGIHGQAALGIAFFVVGLLFKIASAPFHSWMPDVYETTPAPLGAFMAAAVKAAGFASLSRLVVAALPLQEGMIGIFVPLAALTLLIGNGGAMFQSSFARLLGYSSIAHTGFLLMGVAATAHAVAPPGIASVLIYLFSYIPAVFGSFALIALFERKSVANADNPHATGDRLISGMQGLYKEKPVLAVAATIIMASMAGLPPTFGFWGKFEVFRATFHAHQTGLLAVALLTSIMGAYYYVRVIKAIYSDAADGDPVIGNPHPIFAAIVVLSSIALLVWGVFPDRMIELGQMAASSLPNPLAR